MNYTPLLTGVDRNNSRGLFWPELSLRHVLDVAKRQWKCILLVVILAMSAACGILYSLTPLYTAELDLLFENRYHTMETDIEAAFAGRPQDEATVIGEMQVIISRQLATKVIEQLHLDEDPEFNVFLKGASALGRIANSIAQVAGLGRERNEESRMQEEKRRMQEIVDHFLDRLKVMKIKESRVVKVRFTAETPEKAARILNTLDSAYLVSRFEDRLQSSRFVADWLNEKIYDLRSRVDTAERKVAEYRQRHSLVSGEKNSLLKEQISALSVELTEASASRQAVEAKLQQARGLSQRRTEISSANRLFDSELVQQLRQREVELERQAAELGETLGSRHPRMIQLQAEREQLRSDLRGEINRLLDNLKYEVDVARARENALSADVQVAKNQIGDADQAGVGLRALEREAESSRLLLERFMGMLLQIGAEQDVQALFPAARVVSQAYEPVEQSFPRAIPTLMLALVGGLGLGTLLAGLSNFLSVGKYLRLNTDVNPQPFLPTISRNIRTRDA